MEQSAIKLLESLTPGGSEFVNNPQACYEYVQNLLKSQHAQIIKVIKERNELERRLSKLTLM